MYDMASIVNKDLFYYYYYFKVRYIVFIQAFLLQPLVVKLI